MVKALNADMKNNIVQFLMVVLVLTASLSCAEEAITTQFTTYRNPEHVIQVDNGKYFTIVLDSGRVLSNYDWNTEFDSKILKLVDTEYEELFFSEMDPSVGGQRLFTFQAFESGNTSVYMTFIEKLPGQKPKVLDELVFKIQIKATINSE